MVISSKPVGKAFLAFWVATLIISFSAYAQAPDCSFNVFCFKQGKRDDGSNVPAPRSDKTKAGCREVRCTRSG